MEASVAPRGPKHGGPAARRYVHKRGQLPSDVLEAVPDHFPQPLKRISKNALAYVENPGRFPLLKSRLERVSRGRKRRDPAKSTLVIEEGKRARRSQAREGCARFAIFCAQYVDLQTRYVTHGKGGPFFTLEEIAARMTRPGEEMFPISTLCRILQMFRNGALTHRHQGREPPTEDYPYWQAYVASLQLTYDCFRAFRCFGLREKYLEWRKRRDEAARWKREQADHEKRRASAGTPLDGEAGGLIRELARSKDDLAREHHRRQVLAELGPGASKWDVDKETERRLEEQHRRKPPPS